jgi:hypothetical protein
MWRRRTGESEDEARDVRCGRVVERMGRGVGFVRMIAERVGGGDGDGGASGDGSAAGEGSGGLGNIWAWRARSVLFRPTVRCGRISGGGGEGGGGGAVVSGRFWRARFRERLLRGLGRRER